MSAGDVRNYGVRLDKRQQKTYLQVTLFNKSLMPLCIEAGSTLGITLRSPIVVPRSNKNAFSYCSRYFDRNDSSSFRCVPGWYALPVLSGVQWQGCVRVPLVVIRRP